MWVVMNYPTGTVTVLLTDIESSAQLAPGISRRVGVIAATPAGQLDQN
jgi:hypothetical protein